MTAQAMAAVAGEFLDALDEEQRGLAAHEFADPLRVQWTYVPAWRPGVPLLGLGRSARNAAHRLLATALAPHAFAQAVTVMALEEVLDLREDGRGRRHSDDYHLALFGAPGAPRWSWRFEGHHVSVTATVSGDEVEVAPLFLGANPATVSYEGVAVTRPLPLEEELARALLADLPATHRAAALIAGTAPPDILTGTAIATDLLDPPGVRGAELAGSAAALLGKLASVYVDRLAPALRVPVEPGKLAFAWAGPAERGLGHYYRVQGPGLLIEYDNTQNGANHAHSVLRRPGADFGAALLPAHLATEHQG
ncbi:DUF3500 domain-containing protein [Nonomuraea sp. NPDC059023]|uniref:DUF3500 domain-containing protein n=1 Tax=unclassified Nonomuraea TaxID=2593643 RepID=UPI0036D0DED6